MGCSRSFIRSALIVSLLSMESAFATSFMVQPFPETVQSAGIIARGTTGASYARWVEEAGERRIYTYTEFEVSAVFKGGMDSGRASIVRELGGEKDGVAMDVSGAAKFVRGEEVVLFLKGPNADGSYDLRGMMLGKLGVTLDDSGNEVLSGPALSEPGVKHVHEGGHDDTDQSHDSGGVWTVERLKALIRAQREVEEGSQSTGNTAEKTGGQKRSLQDVGSAPPLQMQEPAGGGSELNEEPEPSPEMRQDDDQRDGFGWRVWLFSLVSLLAAGGLLILFMKSGPRG